MAAYDLTTAASVKTYLDISASTWDSLLATLVTSCSVWIENYCGGRRFKNSGTDVTEILDGDPEFFGSKVLFLKNYPIISVTSISYATGTLGSPNWNVYDSANYYVKNAGTGEVWFDSLPSGRQNIRVIYQGGYDSVPEDLSLACTQLVARIFNKRKSEGVSNESVGGASVMWDRELSVEMRKTLNRYRNYAV